MPRLADQPRPYDRRPLLALRQIRSDRAPRAKPNALSPTDHPKSRQEPEYRLVEIHPAEARWEEERFYAPDDETAWSRVLEATTGEIVALWRGGRLVGIRPAALAAATKPNASNDGGRPQGAVVDLMRGPFRDEE